jgi:serine phosphatase RsbU (regulator of sigma subunit)/ligand-binding sensor domain-containing protein
MNRLFLICFILINGWAVYAQQLRPPVTNFTSKDYGTDQTPDNYSLLQDTRGFIYAGNSGGVLMFDGISWEFIKVEFGAYITAMDQDHHGTIYIGNSNGNFGKLGVGKNGKMNFISLTAVFENNKLESSHISKILCIGERTYIYMQESIYVIEGKKITAIPKESPDGTFQIMLKCNNKIYARERGVGLVEITGTKKKIIAANYEFKDYGVLSVINYDAHQLMVVTQEKGLWLLNKENQDLFCFNADSISLKKHLIIGGIHLSDGNFALYSKNSGVLILDKNGKIINIINKTTGLRVNLIWDCIEDRHDNIWVAMSNGIAVINYGSFLHYYDDETGLLGGVECVIKSDKRIYVGTSEGLFTESEKDVMKHFAQANGIEGNVYDLIAYNDVILVASDQGIYSGKKNEFKEILNGEFHSIALLPGKDRVLAAGKESAILFDLKKNKIISEEYFEFSITRGLSLINDPTSSPEKAVMWMGSVGQGILNFTVVGDKITIAYYNAFDDFAIASTRPVIIDNQMYFCTKAGLRKIKDYDKEGRPFFDDSQIIPILDSMSITDVHQTGKRIWVCAETKIFHFEENKIPVHIPFLPIDMGRINNIFAENNKDCWIAASDGLVRYTERYNRNYDQPFDVVLRKVLINGDSALFNGNWMVKGKLVNKQPETDNLESGYKYNSYEFTFSALYFESMNKVLYSHMLEGHDEKWSNWSKENKVKYSNLREGNYTLVVKAKNVYGFESKPLKFNFTILPPWYRTTWAYILYGLTAIMLFIVINRILSHRLKQKNIQLEAIVKKRTQEIEKAHAELQHQKQEITDSINYAQKIQEAMLPFAKEMVVDFPDSFVLFKPKDIVSGDFYWYGKYEGKMVIICADCTGHGVPGAFMSMLCIDKLNQIIPEKKILMPDKILEAANRGIKKSLGQGDEANLKMKDGMDCAVVTVDRTKKVIYYSGANRTLWRIRNNQIEEFKPDKCAVGGFTPEDKVYHLHEIPYEANDRYYMSTDGYADQFGGPRGKKIMVKTFKDILMGNFAKPQKNQSQLLDQFIEEWKKHADGGNSEHEQVDDVCVIGFTV